MSTDNKGGPAFPVESPRFDGTQHSYGMTLRDWFAGLAMNGILANSDRFGGSAGRDAKEAYEFADAMLKERENGQ
jgi:hypothetical protein